MNEVLKVWKICAKRWQKKTWSTRRQACPSASWSTTDPA